MRRAFTIVLKKQSRPTDTPGKRTGTTGGAPRPLSEDEKKRERKEEKEERSVQPAMVFIVFALRIRALSTSGNKSVRSRVLSLSLSRERTPRKLRQNAFSSEDIVKRAEQQILQIAKIDFVIPPAVCSARARASVSRRKYFTIFFYVTNDVSLVRLSLSLVAQIINKNV